MRKQITAGLILIIFTSLNLTANAAIKAGTPCKQLGLTSTSTGKKFTCIKSGKKLIWDKGQLVTKQTTPTLSKNQISKNDPLKEQMQQLFELLNLKPDRPSSN